MVSADFRVGEILDLFSKYSLNDLSHEWVSDVIDSDFTEVAGLPIQFEEVHSTTNFEGLFQAQITSLRLWVDSIPLETRSGNNKRVSTASLDDSLLNRSAGHDQNAGGVGSFWTDFATRIKIKNLMALMCYYVHVGQKYDASQAERGLCCQAACLYFLILCIPGSNAFRVFHPVLYLKALDVLKLANKLNIANSSPKKGKNTWKKFWLKFRRYPIAS